MIHYIIVSCHFIESIPKQNNFIVPCHSIESIDIQTTNVEEKEEAPEAEHPPKDDEPATKDDGEELVEDLAKYEEEHENAWKKIWGGDADPSDKPTFKVTLHGKKTGFGTGVL